MGILGRKLKRLKPRSGIVSGRADAHPAADSGDTPDVFCRALQTRRVDQPDAGSQICNGLTLYHDAGGGLYSWHQTPDCALKLTVYQFDGSYLSLAIGIAEDVISDMRRQGYLCVSKTVTASRPIAAFLRLNVVTDGRHQQMHQTLIIDRGQRTTSFDLDGLPGEFGPIENAWLDLIFADPQMVEVTLAALKIDAAPATATGH